MYENVHLSEREKYWAGEIFGIFLCRKSYEFLSVLEGCTKLEGNGIDDVGGFRFAQEYLEIEEGYFGESGVWFWVFAYFADQEEDFEFIVSNEDFYKILEEESERFNLKYPDRAQEVEGLLAEIKIKLLV